MASVKHQISRLQVMWCNLMHDKTSWPRHGHYICRHCRRVCPMPFS
jgi:hypothetical protein